MATWRRRAAGAAAFAVVAVACAARTDLGGHVSDADASVIDATEEHAACKYCGGQSNMTECTLWAYCPGEIATDAAAVVCNDAPHELDCSCATGTCTCVSHGSTMKTIPFTTCPCDGVHFGQTLIGMELVAACDF